MLFLGSRGQFDFRFANMKLLLINFFILVVSSLRINQTTDHNDENSMNRITGGMIAKPGQFPYQVGL